MTVQSPAGTTGARWRLSARPRSVLPDDLKGDTLNNDDDRDPAQLATRGGARYSTTGVFVCFEGGEGTGKSTQARRLQDWLERAGYSVLLTFEPGDTVVGRQLRRIVLDPATGRLSHRTEALLYAADKAEHVDTVVLPALAEGRVVVTDRYVDSTLAYQGAGRDLRVSDVEAVARWATQDLRPHLTVVLDLAPEHGLGRFAERDRIEGEPTEFHDRVRAAFLAMAAADPEHYLVLDAHLPPDDLEDRVRARVEPLLAQALRPASREQVTE